MGERLAEEMQWGLDVYPAYWEKYGNRAGPIRNAQMLREGKPNLVVAFWDGSSKGTMNMIQTANGAGVEVKVVEI